MNTKLQFLKFGLIGLLNTLVHYLTFIILFKLAGIHMLVASSIGYMLGIINSFFLNRKWTFQVKGNNWRVEAFKFFVVNAFSLAINLLLLETLVKYLYLRPELSQILAIAGSLVVNFWGNKMWTFKHKDGKMTENF